MQALWDTFLILCGNLQDTVKCLHDCIGCFFEYLRFIQDVIGYIERSFICFSHTLASLASIIAPFGHIFRRLEHDGFVKGELKLSQGGTFQTKAAIKASCDNTPC